MRLKMNQSAIDFTSDDMFGNPVMLSKFKGQKVLLSFFRYAACPFCNLRVNRLIQKYDIYKRQGLEIIAVFESSKDSILKYAGKQKAPFTMVADPDRLIYKMYGIESSLAGVVRAMILRLPSYLRALGKGYLPLKFEGDILLLPADFLIDSDFKIHQAYYGRDIGDHMPFEMIESWITKGK